MSLGNNNKSRKLFRQFVNNNSHQYSFADNHSNSMINNNTGEKIGFSLYVGNRPNCRQCYKDYSSVIFYNDDSKKYYNITIDKLYLSKTPTRITSNGVETFNAILFSDYVDNIQQFVM